MYVAFCPGCGAEYRVAVFKDTEEIAIVCECEQWFPEELLNHLTADMHELETVEKEHGSDPMYH